MSSIKDALARAEGRTIVAIILSATYAIVAIIAALRGYVREVLSVTATFISVILGFYFGVKSRERGGERAGGPG